MRNTFFEFEENPEKIAKLLLKKADDTAPDLRLLAYLGHLAPSVHNTQPWQLEIDQGLLTLKISIDPSRYLTHSDPAGRQTWLSIGAFIENISTAATAMGYRPSITNNDGGAKVILGQKIKPAELQAVRAVVDSIVQRCSNRQLFSKSALSPDFLEALAQPDLNSLHCKTVIVTNTETIETIAKMVHEATKLAFSSLQIRHELAAHINNPHQPKPVGIPALSISSMPAAFFEKITTDSPIFINEKAKHESDRIRYSAALALTFTSSDTTSSWLLAGRQYEALCLKATELGLAHSTNAALVEAPDYYKDISELLNQPMRLQTVVRLGKAPPPKARAGRLPLRSVLHIADNT